jgi:hypothetical protein
MRSRIVTGLRVLGASAAAFAAVSMVEPKEAFASFRFLTWTQDNHIPGFSGGPGCAYAIAVGPNNAPWVLGCGGPDGVNDWVFQLKHQGSSVTWVNSNKAGTYVAVGTNSVPWVLTGDGHLSVLVSFFGQGGNFVDETAAYANTGFGGGRLSGIAPVVTGTSAWTLWGLGYPLSLFSNQSIWNAGFTLNSGPTSGWGQVDAQDNAAGWKIVDFAGSVFGTSYQTPVVMNNAGGLYSYDSSTGGFDSFQPPGTVNDVTDHWVITYDNNQRKIFQYFDLQGWNEWIGSLNTPNGTQITRIAYSNTGPSALWGIDTQGHIFTTDTTIAIGQ